MCPSCGYAVPGDGGSVQQGAGCPNCGAPFQPERDQPPGSVSDGRIRNMPEPGMEDTGGNPLQEGILGDWQPAYKRDESFASSVNTAHTDWHHDRILPHIPWHMASEFEIEQVVEPGPHTVEVEAPGQPIIMQHENPEVLDAAKERLARMSALYKKAGLFSTIGQIGGTLVGGALGTFLGPEGTAVGATLGRAVGGALGRAGGGAIDNAGQAGQQAPQQPQIAPPRGIEQLSALTGLSMDFESPSSITKREDTDDPENVDPHEKNDGDNDTWQKDFSVNDVGGTNQDTFGGFDPANSDALAHFVLLAPLVQHYHDQGDGSGAHDPLIQALDQALEGEVPGYKDHPHSPLVSAIMEAFGGGKQDEGAPEVKDEAGDNGSGDSLDDNDIEKQSNWNLEPGMEHDHGQLVGPQSPEEEMLNQPAGTPSPEGTCPECGHYGSMPLHTCPRCLAYNEPFDMRTAAGPHTREQFQAVSDLLKSQGRESEVQTMIDNPDQYEQELAQVQQRQQVQLSDDPAPPMPAMENTPPGAGMPMPPPPTGEVPMGMTGKVGADNISRRCPKCDSHTTGLIDNEGKSRCHSCGNIFKSDISAADGDSSNNSVTARWTIIAEDHDQDQNSIAVPAADQEHREDIAQDQDSGLTWQDENGQPLKAGQQYLIYSPKYSVPQRALINEVKPNSIVYQDVGEYGVNHNIEVHREEALLDKLKFVPDQGQGDTELTPGESDIEQNNDYAGQADPGQQTDLSDSSQYALASSREWLLGHTAGAQFTPHEQRQLIDERGVARNADKLDLTHTHYESGYRDEDENPSFLW